MKSLIFLLVLGIASITNAQVVQNFDVGVNPFDVTDNSEEEWKEPRKDVQFVSTDADDDFAVGEKLAPVQAPPPVAKHSHEQSPTQKPVQAPPVARHSHQQVTYYYYEPVYEVQVRRGGLFPRWRAARQAARQSRGGLRGFLGCG